MRDGQGKGKLRGRGLCRRFPTCELGLSFCSSSPWPRATSLATAAIPLATVTPILAAALPTAAVSSTIAPAALTTAAGLRREVERWLF